MNSNGYGQLSPPKVMIDRIALEKIRYFVEKDSQECSGMGISRVVGDTIYIDDIHMLEQRNGAAHTDIEADAVGKLMNMWSSRTGVVNFWWHSHVNMNTFWSGQDMETIKSIGKNGMCIASVFNKRGEIRTAVCCPITLPFAEGTRLAFFDDLPIKTFTQVTDDLKAAWDAEHSQNVIKQPIMGNAFARDYLDYLGYDGNDNGGTFTQRRWGNTKVFRPCKTRHPDFWDSSDQGRFYDIDWMQGTSLRDSPFGGHDQVWTKSQKYKDAYAAWEKEQAEKKPVSEAVVSQMGGLTGVEISTLQQFAETRGEIKEFHPLLMGGCFELFNGSKVNALWYHSDDSSAIRYRMRMSMEHDSLSADKAFADRVGDAELQTLLKEYEEDLLAHAEDIPNPNNLTEREMEDLCSRQFQA